MVFPAWLTAACLLAITWWSGPVTARESAPGVSDLAAWLAAEPTRTDVLLSTAALARFQQQWREAAPPATANTLRQDRAWLALMVTRFGQSQPRSPVLDPAAWLVQLKLEHHRLQPTILVPTTDPGLAIYLDQVFDRTNEHLAAAVLPELVWQLESRATLVWSGLLEQAEDDQELRAILAEVGTDFFPAGTDEGVMAEAPVTGQVLADAASSLSILADTAMDAGPPDRHRLRILRYSLLAAMPALDGPGRADARALLHISHLVDGLYRSRYFAFAEGLLAVVAGLLQQPGVPGETPGAVVEWLSSRLPVISGNFARAFASVDPRLNSALAAAFDVLQNISRESGDRLARPELMRELADAVAQLALLNPDLEYYFELPVRDAIAGSVDACTAQVAQRGSDGSLAMTRELFDDCQESLVNLADVEARAASLSGDAAGPFGPAELQRELSVTSGQRINYGLGYLHDRYATGCEQPAAPLPNPLEWSALATLLAWFAEQAPVYFQTPENEARLRRMRDIGYELLSTVAEQVDCFAGAGASLSDPVSRSVLDYRRTLVELGGGLNEVITGLRTQLLRPGADIALQLDATQPTAYRPDDLMIGPCDPERVCEMSGELNSTRALLGLFPGVRLVADQAGFGSVEICYDNMEWVRRRSQLVRADDPNVANYFGFLAFDLRGRFVRDGSRQDIFAFRFTSPEEQHYLFAAASEEVLADSCPMEWVGTRIVSPLREGRLKIVPDRLTYLAAPRMVPSRMLAQNWDKGAEWRDWFITGIGVEPLQVAPPADIAVSVTQHLQSLYRSAQSAIYESILNPAPRDGEAGAESLFAEVTELTMTKALIRNQMMLFYPQLLMSSDALRAAVAGQGGLLDSLVLARLRDSNVPVSTLQDVAFARLDQFQREWESQAEATLRTGSVAVGVAHAMMRLNALYRQYFAPAPGESGGDGFSPLAAYAGD